MTEAEAIEELKTLQDRSQDWEWSHTRADAIVVELLESLGLTAVAEEYRKVPKWYA